MLSRPITFDRFVRGLLFLAVVVALVFALRWLSSVLIPFFVAWVLAWMLIPVVRFFQYTCHLRSRVVAVTLTLILTVALLTLLGWTAVPMVVEGVGVLKEATLHLLQSDARPLVLPDWAQHYVDDILASKRIEEYLREDNLPRFVKNALPHVWGMLVSTVNVVMGLVGAFFGVLYLIFLLIDFEYFSRAWLGYMPQRSRPFLAQLSDDIGHNMRGYFRGQALIALWNALLFSIGFSLIGLPMPIGMGIFVGIISFVPYIQVVGFLPAALLALLSMVETGRSFWMLMLLVLLVYVVVQVIQDVFVTPRIMGSIMGLSPALVLLSLSVWGFMAGIVGLIVALPLTTILLAYYRRYIIGSDEEA